MAVPGPRNGVSASTLRLPPGPWDTVLEALCGHFPAISREDWLDRMARGRVLTSVGEQVGPELAYRIGMTLHYFREVADELRIPFEESVVYQDEHLVVADKPHFLPVVPAGRFVEETLLARLVRRLGNVNLVPLHRIDRLTAGLVLFSARPDSRGAYQELFRQRMIGKCYEALAPALPGLDFPMIRRTRLVVAEHFFRMRESEGEANTETRIQVIEQLSNVWRYRLTPLTGKKHQLRVHLAALGAPILNDDLYPVLAQRDAEDYSQPLKLLAQGLSFVDPLDGSRREFASQLSL